MPDAVTTNASRKQVCSLVFYIFYIKSYIQETSSARNTTVKVLKISKRSKKKALDDVVAHIATPINYHFTSGVTYMIGRQGKCQISMIGCLLTRSKIPRPGDLLTPFLLHTLYRRIGILSLETLSLAEGGAHQLHDPCSCRPEGQRSYSSPAPHSCPVLPPGVFLSRTI